MHRHFLQCFPSRLWIAVATAATAANALATPVLVGEDVGHPTFASPHVRPIAVAGRFVFAANTPADTVDVIDIRSRALTHRINVGVDPVSITARPDGNEVWVANHVSDSVSVIDSNAASPTFAQVVATIQDIDADSLATRFDEPVGIAFASNAKAYVALSPANRIAIVDVASHAVTGHLPIQAQEPRAIAVRNGRLYVIPFESNNQSQLSGCFASSIDGDRCTFDAVEHVFTNNNVLSLNYDADIVKNPRLPDRDLFVFDVTNDALLHTVNTLGTLLYGIAVDGRGRVFIAQTDARNVENGRAGTSGHGLSEMQNRAFLNQITRVDCAAGCESPTFFDLEPLPPSHPAPGMALATPFGIAVTPDDRTLVVTAAGSDKVFTVDAQTGAVLGRASVGAVPRGVALVSTPGAPLEAWVLNAVGNSVSVVNVSARAKPVVSATIALNDPTHPLEKRGRIAFNDADASSTGTFSCESCHPDNHTDQLVWVLDTPRCDIEGCTQIPPRLTMPVRGLRDTQPYHWDGIPGDPYGGNNTASINADVAPNCRIDEPEACARFLVDGSMATTMCDVTDCPRNDEGKAGPLDGEARDALAQYILNATYPPAPGRAYDNVLSRQARDGFFEFSFLMDSSGRTTGAQTCGACHRPPFLVSTNTPGTGMDAPTWRGAYERWTMLPQGRLNILDLMTVVGMNDTFPERDMWILAGATPNVWEMVLQGSTGFHGGFARQVTLNRQTSTQAPTAHLLAALETSAGEGAIVLQGEGLRFVNDAPTSLKLEFAGGAYMARDGAARFSRSALLQEAAAGQLVLTFTGRLGPNVGPEHPPPALWPVAPIQAQTRTVEMPFLGTALTLRLNGRHVPQGAATFVDGRRVDGSVRCESGTLPGCAGETLIIELAKAPQPGGLHFLQLQAPGGLFSNDLMFFSEQSPLPPRRGNLIASGGTFSDGRGFDDLTARRVGQPNNWNTVEIATNSIEVRNRAVHVSVREASSNPWHAQISHAATVIGGQQYTLCYQARTQGARVMTAYMDSNMDGWRNISGGQFRANLGRAYRSFRHTFTVRETDLFARVAFDFAQSALDVWLDNIGLYEGSSCGTP